MALTPEEARRALASPNLNDDQRAMLGLFLLGGLRLGEQMAITRGQIDFKRGLIHIDRAVRVEYGGKQFIGLPKKDKVRDAVLCEALAEILSPVCEGLEPTIWNSSSRSDFVGSPLASREQVSIGLKCIEVPLVIVALGGRGVRSGLKNFGAIMGPLGPDQPLVDLKSHGARWLVGTAGFLIAVRRCLESASPAALAVSSSVPNWI